MKINQRTGVCDPEYLKKFLDGALSQTQEAELTDHLDSCVSCRCALEEMAAGPELWSDAQTYLKSSGAQTDEPIGSNAIDYVLNGLNPTDNPAMLGRLQGYEISGVIGAGGMGVVLKGVDPALDRTIAIKVLAPHLAMNGAARKRFAREAKAAAAVLHPNVIAIHSVTNEGAWPFLVMPYIRGTSLQKRLDQEGPLSLQEILRIGSQVAAGLAAAHAQGLVHRDIKPANILLEEGVERVTITDFGLARTIDDASITQSGAIAGTPQYMSPEQARGEGVDPRSDLFSLGSLLYAMCTGRPPFRAETTYGVLRRITDDSPTPLQDLNPEIPKWLCDLITRLMAKNPAERFGSAREVMELLEQCLAHVQQPSTYPLPEPLRPQFSNRNNLIKFPIEGTVIKFGGIAMLACILVFGISMLPPSQSDPDQTKKEQEGNRLETTGDAPAKEVRGTATHQQTLRNAPAQVQTEDPDADRPKEFTKFGDWRKYDYTTKGHALVLAISHDTRRIAVANGNPTRILMVNGNSRVADGWKATVDLLDSETGKVERSLVLLTPGEAEMLEKTRITHVEATALAFSPGGGELAVGTSIGQVKIYNTVTGELIKSLDDQKSRQEQTPKGVLDFPRGMGNVNSVAWSPDGKSLAAAGGTFSNIAQELEGVTRLGLGDSVEGIGRLKVWNIETGTITHDLPGHGSQVQGVFYSPDGSKLISIGGWMDPNRVHYGSGVMTVEPKTGELLNRRALETNGFVFQHAISPDGKLLGVASIHFSKDDDSRTTQLHLLRSGTGILEWNRSFEGIARLAGFTEGVFYVQHEDKILGLRPDTGSTLFSLGIGHLVNTPPAKADDWSRLIGSILFTDKFFLMGTVEDRVGTIHYMPLGDSSKKVGLDFSVKGKVTDEEGKPLAGVRVLAHCGSGTLKRTGEMLTDENGNYHLSFGPGLWMKKGELVQAATISPHKTGWYELNLYRQGNLLMADHEQPDFKGYAGLVLPNAPYELNFKMAPGETIEGTLVNEFGTPIEGEQISLEGELLPPSSNVLDAVITDKQGKFQFEGVPLKVETQEQSPEWFFSLRILGVRNELITKPFVIRPDGEFEHVLKLGSDPKSEQGVGLTLEHQIVPKEKK